MRAFTRLSVLVGVALIANTAMAATKYVAADDSRESRICVSAAMDAPIRFHSTVEASGIKLRTVAKQVTCNDVGIGQFAASAGNARNAKKLLKFYSGDGRVEIRNEVSLNNGAGINVASADRVVYLKGRQ